MSRLKGSLDRAILFTTGRAIRTAAIWSESLVDDWTLRTRWSPLDRAVSVLIDDSDDDDLADVRLQGVVRGCSSRADVWPHELLIELNREVSSITDVSRAATYGGWSRRRACVGIV